MHKVTAINIADSINIRGVKTELKSDVTSQSNTELFYALPNNRFMAVFNNGVISFANFEKQDISHTLSKIKRYIKNPEENISETISIKFIDDSKVSFSEDTLYVPKEFDSNDLMKIVMYDLSQTVAIDYYSKISKTLISEVEKFASELERKGKLSISQKKMNKFIGKSLNTKNKIVSNLYIWDVPDIAWDDESLDIVHATLNRTFDISNRIKELQYTIDVVDDNLETFRGMYEHKHSSFLEIVVIILILVEILQTLDEKLKIVDMLFK